MQQYSPARPTSNTISWTWTPPPPEYNREAMAMGPSDYDPDTMDVDPPEYNREAMAMGPSEHERGLPTVSDDDSDTTNVDAALL